MTITDVRPSKSNSRLREAHHRIANNLTLIAGFVRLQSSKVAKEAQPLSAPEVCLLLEEINVRIQTVGRLHHLLAVEPDSGRIDVGEYLCSTCGILAQSVCITRSIDLTCDARSCMIPPEGAALLGLIVTELVTNSVKYAHPTGVPGRISVRCRGNSGGRLVLTVSDDGVGLPEGFDPRTDGGLGMRVMRSLADQLDAVLDFNSSPLGLVVTVTAS